MPEVKIDEREVLEMALAGYALKRVAIENEIERVRLLLRVMDAKGPLHPVFQNQLNRITKDSTWRPVAVKTKSGWTRVGRKPARVIAAPSHRKLSPEGRARIIAATRKRWARYRREKAKKAGGGKGSDVRGPWSNKA